jgi:acyl-CoA reductase-like NAD-dependent aldehyde dehydrogenase
MAVERIHRYLGNAHRWLRTRIVFPGLYFFKFYFTQPYPFGTVLVISPWNYPFELAMPFVVSALLAGNTVILKPSEVTPAVGKLMEDLFKRVPELAPFVRVLHGDGKVGAAAVSARPDLVYLTGSTATAHKVAAACAEHLIPHLFELGGKDAMIVLDDADVDAAARWGVWGACYNAGQSCVAVERIYVVESRYHEFLQKVVAEAERYTVGYSPDKESRYHSGPLTMERQVNICRDHLEDAKAKGAWVLTGGKIQGNMMEPTVIVDVNHDMKLMREETFGPIIPVMKVKDEAEAIRLANDSEYGLSASVWSKSLAHARRVADQLEVGSVVINDALAHYAVAHLPFGGVKKSGTARSHGSQEVLQFTQLRSYAIGQPPASLDLATQMRDPGHYWLGSAILHLVFGVTLEQKLRPLQQLFGAKKEAIPTPTQTQPSTNGHQPKRIPAGLVAGVAGVLGAAALIFAFKRGKK